MSVFFTADTHFGHANIIRYCNRPFDSVDEMNNTLLELWNSMVRPTDTVYHLGDVFFRSPEEAHTISLIRKLHGKKYLVPGNHDQKGRLELLGGLFELLPPLHEITIRGKGQSTRVILCHYPLETWNGVFHGSIMLHGHVHGRLPGNTQRTDVGVDVWDFMPVSLERVLARVTTEATLPFELRGDTEEEKGSDYT